MRRSLYEHVRAQGHPVSREEAADAIRISRNLAAFHLDKLVEVGLLRARYEASAGKPRGRGRTPKVYEPTDQDVSLSVPERQYELIGEILADAVATAPTDARQAAVQRAFDLGRSLVHPAGSGQNPRTVLADLGFAPHDSEPGVVVLRNCPFHALVARQPGLICGLNHAFVNGLLDGLRSGAVAEVGPRPGACCVVLRGVDQPTASSR